MVLIAVKTANTKKKGRPSFRPLAGIMVLIFKGKVIVCCLEYGFRPLAGIMVLIFVNNFIYYNCQMEEFPSPCGDYGSYRLSLEKPGVLR